MKLWVLALLVGLSWAAPMAIGSDEDTLGIDLISAKESSNSIGKTPAKEPADAEMTFGDDDGYDQFQSDVEAACGVNTGTIQPEQIEPLMMAFENLWKSVHNSTGLTPDEYESYISFILNQNNTKEERLANVEKFLQTTIFDPKTQEGGDVEAAALYSTAGILIDLTDFLRAGVANNEENPFATIAELLIEMLIHLPEISPVNRENTRENVCAYMAEFIRQMRKNIHVKFPLGEIGVKGSGDEGKITVKGPEPGNKVESETTIGNGTDTVEEPSVEDDDTEASDVRQNGTTKALPPAESPEVVHTNALSDDDMIGVIEAIAEVLEGDGISGDHAHTNTTEQPEVSPAPEGNGTETTTQEPESLLDMNIFEKIIDKLTPGGNE